MSSLQRVLKIVASLLPVVLLAGCGGGSGGGFTGTENTLSVRISTADGSNTVAWNPTQQPLALNQPFTKQLVVEVFDQNGQYYPASQISVDVIPAGTHGSLYIPVPPGGTAQDSGPFSTAVLKQTTGIAKLFFVSNNLPGTVTITATVSDPASKRQVSASLQLQVVGKTEPVSSLAFTGPYVNAVQAGSSSVGLGTGGAVLPDGSYRRVISVIATDSSGNPPQVGTPIDFSVIDGPLAGFPNNPGAFTIAGNDGDPLEGGYDFYASSGRFSAKGVLPGEQLVLDGINFSQPNNRALTGIRTIASVQADNALAISQAGNPFNTNSGTDTGPTVPYIVGRPESANILATGTTNDSGVASTLLTYPASQVGKAAIVVACTVDQKTCTVLNTCDARGQNCGAVFLPVSSGTNITLTAAPVQLGANTTTPVTLCLKDPNFTPLQATSIDYSIGSALGSATVTVNGNSALAGSLTTGKDGCVTPLIASSGQAPGSSALTIAFQADGVATPVTVTIASPGAGTMTANMSCDLTQVFAFNAANTAYQQCKTNNSTDPTVCGPAPTAPSSVDCTVDLRLTDSQGGAISGNLVNASTTGASLLSLAFQPAYDQNTGLTDADGKVTANLTFQTTATTTVTFSAGAASASVTSPFVAP